MTVAAAAAAADLWRFSTAFYREPGVAEALIALQDEAGIDVNLVLFGLWLGLSGRGRLDTAGLEAARRAVRPLAAAVIEPLRDLRRRLKSDPDADIQRLREGIKSLEIEAEHLAQNRLSRLALPVRAAGCAQRLANAESNLAIVLGAAAAAKSGAALDCRLRDFASRTLSPSAAARPSV